MDDHVVSKLENLFATGKPIGLPEIRDALRHSEEWWNVIFDIAGVVVLIGDTEGNILAVTPSVERIFGYTEEEFVEIGPARVTHPDDLQADLALFTELMEGKRDHYQLEKRYFRKDGSMLWGRLTVLLLRDSDSVPKFAIAMVQEITESKRAQEIEVELREARARRKQALELNDSVVQGLVVAKMALEAGLEDRAASSLLATLEQARSIVSDLLGDFESSQGLGPDTFVRSSPPDRPTPEGGAR